MLVTYSLIKANPSRGGDAKPSGLAQRRPGCRSEDRVPTASETPAKTRFVLSRIQQSHVMLKMPYPREPKVTRWGCDLSGGGWCGDGERNSVKDLAGYANSGYFYDAAGDRLYLKIHNERGNEYNELRVEPKGA